MVGEPRDAPALPASNIEGLSFPRMHLGTLSWFPNSLFSIIFVISVKDEGHIIIERAIYGNFEEENDLLLVSGVITDTIMEVILI